VNVAVETSRVSQKLRFLVAAEAHQKWVVPKSFGNLRILVAELIQMDAIKSEDILQFKFF